MRHAVELCGLCIARANKARRMPGTISSAIARDLVLPVPRPQVPHGGFRADTVRAPRRHVHGCGDQATSVVDSACGHLVIWRIPAEPQILQHAIERGLAVQGDGEIALGCE